MVTPSTSKKSDTEGPSVVLYSTSSDASNGNRRSSIIGRPPPADLFSSLKPNATADPVVQKPLTSPSSTSITSALYTKTVDDELISRRPSVVSFTEPVGHPGHLDRTRSVGSLFHQIHHSQNPSTSINSAQNKIRPGSCPSPIDSASVAHIPSARPMSPPPLASAPSQKPTGQKVTSMIIDSDKPSELPKFVPKPNQSEISLIQTNSAPETQLSQRDSKPQDLIFRTPFATNPASKPVVSSDKKLTVTTNSSTGQDNSPISTTPSKLTPADTPAVTTMAPVTSPSPSIEPHASVSKGQQSEAKPKAQEELNSFFSDEESERHELHILIAATGSVATIKIPLIIAKLRKMYGSHAVIQLIVTTAAEHFLRTVKLPSDIKVWHDHDEWTSRRGVAETVLHVKLRRWADILLIAPLSANTLAKMANGICDNLITSVFRAWNSNTPVVVAPAMNTHMYTNPMTKKHLTVLQTSFPYVHVLKPIEKVLVCGDIGMGGMREWTDVVDNVVRHLGGLPKSIEEEEEEEEREKQEKRAAAKKRRESLDAVQAPEKRKETKIEEADEDNDDDDDDDEDDEDDDESEKARAVPQKPKLVRSNTAEI